MSYDPANERFGRRAHRKAWPQVYQAFLPDSVVMVDLSRTERDYEKDEDYAASIHIDEIGSPVELSFQEKFRRQKWASERDLTLAYYNEETEENLYFEKSEADFFLYGYYDSANDTLGETIIVSMTRLKTAFACGRLEYDTFKHGSKGHRFLTIPFDDLKDEDLIEHHYDSFYEPDPVHTYERGETIKRFRDSKYWVTRDGHVWSGKARTKDFLTAGGTAGYNVFRLSINGESQTFSSHRLVAETYHGPPPTEDSVVDHLNGRRYDNRASNLEWVTRSENGRRARN